MFMDVLKKRFPLDWSGITITSFSELVHRLGLPLFGVIGLASIISMIGMPFPMEFIPQNLYTGMDQFPLIATIGFVMAGFLMEPAGITGEIIEVAKKAVGNIRGGLAMVTILACMIFAALSGSGPATTAAIGSIMIPGMIAAGYRKDDAAAVSATGGTLGILIPPSNPMIIYGVVANTSIAGLFMAGFIPGFVMTTSMCITAYCIARKRGYKGTGEKFSVYGLLKAPYLRASPAEQPDDHLRQEARLS